MPEVVPVPGLKLGGFLVYGQRELKQFEAFSRENRPAMIGLVLDNSRSTGSRRRDALEPAAFVDLSNLRNDFFVIRFNDDVRLGRDSARF